jgi:transposase
VTSIAAKIACTAQSLNEWVKKAEIDSGARGGVPTEIAKRLKALERENRELRQANEILRKASAYFAQAELSTAGSFLEEVWTDPNHPLRGEIDRFAVSLIERAEREPEFAAKNCLARA